MGIAHAQQSGKIYRIAPVNPVIPTAELANTTDFPAAAQPGFMASDEEEHFANHKVIADLVAKNRLPAIYPLGCSLKREG